VLIRVEHVTGEEKYEVLMLNNVIIWSIISVGIVQCDFFKGSILEILYLYLSYNHMISVTNGCQGGSSCWCVLALLIY
jgi:hypothetical protein